jgi:hypothetical protein
MPPQNTIAVEVSFGEVFDKIAILEIKAERLADPGQLRHVREELETLNQAVGKIVAPSRQLGELTAQLKAVNLALWQIEDDIRQCERQQDFGPRFIELARSVYFTNDRRSALKREINHLLGSRLVEEKSYQAY